MSVKIGVISDTHVTSETKKLSPAIADAFRGVDMIIHAGDLVDLSVLKLLKIMCPNVKAVCGNMDNPEAKKKLPEKEIIRLENAVIGVMHGFGPPDKVADCAEEVFKNDGVNVVIFGHSHKPFNKKKGKILFFNPGSATDHVFAPYNSVGIIEINDSIEAKIVKI